MLNEGISEMGVNVLSGNLTTDSSYSIGERINLKLGSEKPSCRHIWHAVVFILLKNGLYVSMVKKSQH